MLKLYHATPAGNEPSIRENGILIDSGVQTSESINNHICLAQDPEMIKEFLYELDDGVELSLITVNANGLEIYPDPDCQIGLPKGMVSGSWIVKQDIEPSRLLEFSKLIF